jgi:hypothetical protein
MHERYPNVSQSIANTNDLDKDTEETLKRALDDYNAQFKK